MGLNDRDYSQEHFRGRFGNAPQMRMSFPQITPAVKWLLIINVAIYFIQILGADRMLTATFSVYPAGWKYSIQIWRLISYQFLHDPQNPWHLICNMLGLYFLGPTLERHWGSKKFLKFYLGCGVAGGLLYILLASIDLLSILPMLGASGAILGMLAACAILFPHFVVFIIVFPVPIRIAAIGLIIFASAIILLKGENAGGEAAHLGGMAAGALYVFSTASRQRLKAKFQTGIHEKKIEDQRKLQFELDRILKKVHDNGIQSLTWQEKKTLKKATQHHQQRNP
ncbi:MAG: rhomboid family intramembrane serine protease [Planctomycetes bacterium]|nr:rhomboid family intramembrane serine protease [Planctomycetota bacterium]